MPASVNPANLHGIHQEVLVTMYQFQSFSWIKSMSQIVGLTAAWQQDKVEGNPMGTNTTGDAKTNFNSVHTEFNFFL